VTALSFPGFFTPNGDGINDYWNIRELRNQSEATIYIFDRYGKLLEQIYPVQIGWDGTYNGRPMPSQDYWFIVEFTDEITGNKLSYNNHFTLKR
jgi:gliding motility-associated-like protein